MIFHLEQSYFNYRLIGYICMQFCFISKYVSKKKAKTAVYFKLKKKDYYANENFCPLLSANSETIKIFFS